MSTSNRIDASQPVTGVILSLASRQGDARHATYVRSCDRATAVGLLAGWDGPFVDDSYCLVENGHALMYSRAGAIDACLRLRVHGVQPLYRASEPTDL